MRLKSPIAIRKLVTVRTVQPIKLHSTALTNWFRLLVAQSTIYAMSANYFMLTILPFNQRRTTRECVHLVTLAYPVFCSCDLDLDPMILTYELGLGILKMPVHTKNEVSRSRLSKVRAWTGQSDRHDRNYYHAAFAGGNKKNLQQPRPSLYVKVIESRS